MTDQQQQNMRIVELSILFQRAIEIMDDLEATKNPTKNKKLNAQLKAVYGPLDKETKKYDEFYRATQGGTSAFYEIICANTKLIMSNNIIDKSLVAKTLLANEKNPKSLDGILNKILKE